MGHGGLGTVAGGLVVTVQLVSVAVSTATQAATSPRIREQAWSAARNLGATVRDETRRSPRAPGMFGLLR